MPDPSIAAFIVSEITAFIPTLPTLKSYMCKKKMKNNKDAGYCKPAGATTTGKRSNCKNIFLFILFLRKI